MTRASQDQFDLVAEAIRFLEANGPQHSSLAEVATHVGLSEFHFQRLFVEWAGLSPKEFVQAITIRHAKQAMLRGASLLDTSLDVGLSGPSRLHDLMLSVEAMTPGEFKKGGEGLEVRWDVASTPFGSALFATTLRGLAKISFCDSTSQAEQELRRFLPRASFVRDSGAISPIAQEVSLRMQGERPQATLGVLLSGSPFRLKVWRALMEVPYGTLLSYGTLARLTNQPTAVRAVASSVACNELAFLIPCHRVIRDSGEIGQYRWSSERKKLMVARETFKVAG